MKRRYLIISILIIILVILFVFIVNNKNKNIVNYEEFQAGIIKLETYDDYINNKDKLEENLKLEDFENYSYILVKYTIDECSEKVNKKYYNVEKNKLNIYYEMDSSCGVCAPIEKMDLFKIKKDELKDNINVYYKTTSNGECSPVVVYKPMIYIYPEKEMDLKIKLGNDNLLTSTYPKYNNEWNVHVNKNGNIYDYNTKRNYYGLYWEAKDYNKLEMDEGFVIKGSETVKFLEEKLSFLGLNEYEINEFITYWISKFENNRYNYFKFRTKKEINKYMPLYISEKPDTLIRILIDFKPLNKYINIKEQKLKENKRNGFTIIEWGVTPHYE